MNIYLCDRLLAYKVGGGGDESVARYGSPAHGANHLPPPPMAPHHALHLAVQEAVGQADHEALSRRDDGLHGVGHNDDEGHVDAGHGRLDHQRQDVAEAK